MHISVGDPVVRKILPPGVQEDIGVVYRESSLSPISGAVVWQVYYPPSASSPMRMMDFLDSEIAPLMCGDTIEFKEYGVRGEYTGYHVPLGGIPVEPSIHVDYNGSLSIYDYKNWHQICFCSPGSSHVGVMVPVTKKETPCPGCKRNNDIGVKSCWCCGGAL